ncbi:MAG: helix-turn-helix domain-containing protein [Streptosporangiaceae bacterium]
MTEAMTLARPWQALPPELAETLRPDLPALADEIVEEIRHCVPEFDRPLQGTFGVGIRLGVEQGLSQFVDRVAVPDPPRTQEVTVPRALGRGEFREGRSMDALQAAYRIGARVAWRRFATTGLGAGFSPETMCALAEAVFAYIDEVAAQSVQGYAELGARAMGALQRRRRRLLELLIALPPTAPPEMLARLAAEAQWRLPATVACVTLDGPWQDPHRISPAVSPDVLMDLERNDPCLLVPDPDGPGRPDMLKRAFPGLRFAVGPSVPLADAAVSARLARQLLLLAQRGTLAEDSPLRCADHLPTMLMCSDEDVTDLMSRRMYGPLAELKPQQRARLTETLLAFLATGGSAPEISARLCVHAQTVRYRLHRLEEMFGERLHDPEWRFEMQIVLRTRLLRDGQG